MRGGGEARERDAGIPGIDQDRRRRPPERRRLDSVVVVGIVVVGIVVASSFDGWLAEAGIVIDGVGRSSRLSSGGERPAASTGDSDDASFGTDWYEFDVEGFATIWRDDDDASFAAKIAALSLFVAAGVRCASLASGPDFADDGDLAWARGLVAGAMMSTPLALNVAKWKRRGGSLAAEISGPFPETALGEVVGVDAEGMEELERAR